MAVFYRGSGERRARLKIHLEASAFVTLVQYNFKHVYIS
jgi:hypothetical protein